MELVGDFLFSLFIPQSSLESAPLIFLTTHIVCGNHYANKSVVKSLYGVFC